MEWMTIGWNHTDLSGSFISRTDPFSNKGFGLGICRRSDKTRKHPPTEVDLRPTCSLCPSAGPSALAHGVIATYVLWLHPVPSLCSSLGFSFLTSQSCTEPALVITFFTACLKFQFPGKGLTILSSGYKFSRKRTWLVQLILLYQKKSECQARGDIQMTGFSN